MFFSRKRGREKRISRDKVLELTSKLGRFLLIGKIYFCNISVFLARRWVLSVDSIESVSEKESEL